MSSRAAGERRAFATEVQQLLHLMIHSLYSKREVFLRAHGLGAALASRIVKRYGANASALVQANPYRLADDVLGVGLEKFPTATRKISELVRS